MELKDYYAIMGVKPTDDLKTIKTAYRRLARKYHPDVSKEPDAEARFKEVAEAWEVLSDEQRRASMTSYGNTVTIHNLIASSSNTKASRITPKILMIFSRLFLVSTVAIRTTATPHAVMISKLKWRYSWKKRWKSTSVRLAIPSPFITRSAWWSGKFPKH